MSGASQWLEFTSGIFNAVAVGVALISLVFVTAGALRTLTRRLSRIEISGVITPADIEKFQVPATTASPPFETTALANYYNQVLSRAQISFWFSIVFASIGFGVIIFAFVTHSPNDIEGTLVKVTSGIVIDAVSSLFFVQSTGAQKSMSEFFEKLRLDRLNAEARSMIDEIKADDRRDQLRAQLILKYSGIEKLLTDIEAP